MKIDQIPGVKPFQTPGPLHSQLLATLQVAAAHGALGQHLGQRPVLVFKAGAVVLSGLGEVNMVFTGVVFDVCKYTNASNIHTFL